MTTHSATPDARRRWLWGLTASVLISCAVTVAALGLLGNGTTILLPRSTLAGVLAGFVGLVVLFVVYVGSQNAKLRHWEAELRQRAMHEELLRVRLNELAALLDVSGELSQEFDVYPMLELAARRLLVSLEADHSSIVLFNTRTKRIEEAAAVGQHSAVDGPVSIEPGSGVLGHVFEARETMNVESEESRVRLAAELRLTGTPQAAVCAPIVFEEVCLGVLCVARVDRDGAFGPVEARALRALADQCGAAIVRRFHAGRGRPTLTLAA